MELFLAEFGNVKSIVRWRPVAFDCDERFDGLSVQTRELALINLRKLCRPLGRIEVEALFLSKDAKFEGRREDWLVTLMSSP